MAEQNVMELLLASKEACAPRKSVKLKRLSEQAGADVVLELRALSYAEVLELKREPADLGTGIVLAGVASPDLHSMQLVERYKATTPAEALQRLLLPGEIEELAREIERLSGYRTEVLEEFQKN